MLGFWVKGEIILKTVLVILYFIKSCFFYLDMWMTIDINKHSPKMAKKQKNDKSISTKVQTHFLEEIMNTSLDNY